MEEGRATEQHSPRTPRRRPARGCRRPPRSPPRDARQRLRRGGRAPPRVTSTTGDEELRTGSTPRMPRRAAAQRRRRSRRLAERRTAGSAPTTTYGRLEHALERSARPCCRAGPASALVGLSSVGRRFPRDLPVQSPRVLHQELVHGLVRPGRWCRPSICSIWWNARFNDFSHTLGFRSSKTPPQTRQPVLGDGQGVGAYSKSKLLLLVRYCYTK